MATKPDLSDTLTALKMHLGKTEADLKYDIDGNGIVDLTDVLGLQKAYLGKDPGFVFAENSYFQSPSTKTAADYAAEREEAKIPPEVRAQAKAVTPSGFAEILQNIQDNKNLEENFKLYEYAKQNSPEIAKTFAPHIQYYDALRGMMQHRISATGYDIPADEYAVWQMVPKDVQEKLKANARPGQTTAPVQGANGVNYTANVDANGNITGYNSNAGTHIAEATHADGQYNADGSPNPNIYVRRSHGFLGDALGGLGDLLKSLGPIPMIVGNAIMPGAGSALGAILALDEGNTTGAVLSGLNAAGAMGGNAATNALSAEVSGNVDLANQYSSGVPGALASNAGTIKTASDAAQLANAINTGNIGGALTAAGNLTGVSASPEVKTGMAVAGLAKALNNGDTAGAVALAGQLTGSADAKVAAQALRIANALNNGNIQGAISAGVGLAKTAEPYLKEAKLSSTLTGEDIDPSQFDAAELLFGTNAGSLGDASDLAGLQDTGTSSNQLTQQDLVDIVNGGIGDATLTGGTGASDTITGGTTAQPNVEYYGDGTYKVTYEDGTSAIFNADGSPYSTVDNTGTNNLSIIVDDSSPSGYRDSLGQPVNQDGTPYVAPAGNDTLTGGQSTVTGGQSTSTGGQSTVAGGQSTVPGGSGGLNLGALMALLGAGQGQQAPTPPPVVDIGEQLDLEEALQTNPFAKKQTQSKMATGGSIDDLLALLQQRG